MKRRPNSDHALAAGETGSRKRLRALTGDSIDAGDPPESFMPGISRDANIRGYAGVWPAVDLENVLSPIRASFKSPNSSRRKAQVKVKVEENLDGATSSPRGRAFRASARSAGRSATASASAARSPANRSAISRRRERSSSPMIERWAVADVKSEPEPVLEAEMKAPLPPEKVNHFRGVVQRLRKLDCGFDEISNARQQSTYTWNENAALLLCTFVEECKEHPFKAILPQFNAEVVRQRQELERIKIAAPGADMDEDDVGARLRSLRPERDRSSVRKRLQKSLGTVNLTKVCWPNARRLAAASFVEMIDALDTLLLAGAKHASGASGAQEEMASSAAPDSDDAATSEATPGAQSRSTEAVEAEAAASGAQAAACSSSPKSHKAEQPLQVPYLDMKTLEDLRDAAQLMRDSYDDLDTFIVPSKVPPSLPQIVDGR